MKKLVALSVCLSASTILLAASPSFSQTVTVPITGTTIGLNVDLFNNFSAAYPNSFIVNTTLLTPLGAVSVSEFNGSISTTTPGQPNGLFNVVASQISHVVGLDIFNNGKNSPLTTFIFVGTTNGTAPFVPNNAFTNAPTTINATFDTAAGFTSQGLAKVDVPITGGSITLPAPPPVVVVTPVVTCTDCLNVIPDLRISNSTFLSPASQQPEYSQEYSRNNFSTSSFDGGRVLGLENK
ncbi:MAG: hypothetical protein M1G31_20310 [Pseudanabaena sp. Salubria-1]|nr:hypothetical protein [Pseudanabaena sp. Salubria-1]